MYLEAVWAWGMEASGRGVTHISTPKIWVVKD